MSCPLPSTRSFHPIYTLLEVIVDLTARLPFWALYRISDIGSFLAYHVLRYRRKIVRRNLEVSFPEKTAKEIRLIERRFYRNLMDLALETIKLAHITDGQMAQRMTFENLELIDSLLDQGKSVAVYFSHCGNWEWGASMTMHMRHRPDEGVNYCQVYRPLKAKRVDALMLRLRSRFHSHSCAKKVALLELMRMRRQGLQTVTCFMSDQKPSWGDEGHVVEFLHHPTALITGTEVLARRMDMAAVYWDMEKTRRGRYRITSRLLSPDVSKEEVPMTVTSRYGRMLEATIKRQPDIWLWSHNRWKHPVKLPASAPTDGKS